MKHGLGYARAAQPDFILLEAMLPQVGSFAYSTGGDAVALLVQGIGVGLVTRTVDTGDL